MQWCTMDLHLHTPASIDYQQPDVSYLDILRRAEMRGLEIIAFTDHNTVAGYRKMQEEIQQLKLLEKLNRLLP
jgi:predicted metal-dependent phosphoesterase TrpH